MQGEQISSHRKEQRQAAKVVRLTRALGTHLERGPGTLRLPSGLLVGVKRILVKLIICNHKAWHALRRSA